jgi:hypothetical protein
MTSRKGISNQSGVPTGYIPDIPKYKEGKVRHAWFSC